MILEPFSKHTKVLLAIFVLLLIGGIFYLFSPTWFGKNQIQVKNEDPKNFEIAFPESLNQKYIKEIKWPPTVTIGEIDQAPPCEVTGPYEEAGRESSLPTTVSRQFLAGEVYCIEAVSEGAAGSTYTEFTYTTIKDDKLIEINFTLQFPRCDNYDEPEKTACARERVTLDLDNIISEAVSKG